MEIFYEIDRGLKAGEPQYTFIMTLIVGILCSGISFGLVYVIAFIIVWEFLYFGYCDCNGKNYDDVDRIIIALGGLLGFLLGRFMLDQDDHLAEFKKFQKDYHHYGREFGWFDCKSEKRRMKRKNIEMLKKKYKCEN